MPYFNVTLSFGNLPKKSEEVLEIVAKDEATAKEKAFNRFSKRYKNAYLAKITKIEKI
jgi:hypothetical protein